MSNLTVMNNNLEMPPLNIPSIRLWELDENSTHYDRMVAAPSDAEIMQFWKGWATILILTIVVTTGTLLPLIFSRSIRHNTFNFYLIFLLIPDMIWAWLCESTCLSNVLAGHFTSATMCQWQSFYGVFAIAANSWMNLVVAQQLFRMLTLGQRFRRYQPPSGRLILTQACAVYIYAMLLAAMALFDAPWWPHKTRLAMGAFCIPMDYDTTSTVVFYVLFFPLLFGIPLLYVCWVAFQIWYQNLLPAAGRRRILAIYFFRLFAVFVVMWLPALILMFVTSPFMDPWFQFAGGAWSHMQGVVSAVVSWWKPDIGQAVYGFWTCQHWRQNAAAASDKEGANSQQQQQQDTDDDDDASVVTVGFGAWTFVSWNILGSLRNSTSTAFNIDDEDDGIESEIKRISAIKIEWDAEMMLGNDFSSSAGYDDPQQQQESQRNVCPVPTNSQMFLSITSRVNDDNDDDDDDSYQVPLGWSTNGPVVDDEHLATAAPQGQHDDDKERYHDQHDIESGRQRTDTPSQLNKQSPGQNGPVGHTQQLDKKEQTPQQNAPVDGQLHKASPVENPKNQDGFEKQTQPTTSKDNNTPFINPPNPAIRENELDISDLSLPQHSQSSYLDISGLTHKSPPSSHLDVSQLSFESFP